MGTLIGVAVGYVMGARAGNRSLEEIKEAWTTIRTSEEARAMVGSGWAVARSLLGRGSAMLAERLQAPRDPHASVFVLEPAG